MPAIGLGIVMALCAEVAQPPAMELHVVDIAPSAEVVGEDAVGLDVTFEVTGRPGGSVSIHGALHTESGTPITIQDVYFRSAVPMVSVELDDDGRGRGVRRFSGEAIRMAMVDGPWEARLVATETGAADGQPAMREVSVPTPAFAADDFGEQVGRLVHAEADVRESLVTVRLIVDVSERFEAHATGFVGDAGESRWSGQNLHERVWLEPGMREVVLTWDASEAMAEGIEPPYSVVPGVADVATLTTLQPRRAQVPAEIVADWHPTERRRREAAAAEASE